MNLAWRINALAVAFAVGYLFVGACTDRAHGALEPSGLKIALGCGGALCLAFVLERGGQDDEAARPEEAELQTCRNDQAQAESALRDNRGTVGDCGAPVIRDKGNKAVGPDWRRCMRMFELAFQQGSVVESAYWLAIAQLRGADGCEPWLEECARIWTDEDCPGEEERVHAGFSTGQSAFGRAVLQCYSSIDVPLAIAQFAEMATAGNADAAAFLKANVCDPAEVRRT